MAFAAGVVLAVKPERIALVGLVGPALEQGKASVLLGLDPVDFPEEYPGTARLVRVQDVLRLGGVVPVAGLRAGKVVREDAPGRLARTLAVLLPVVKHVPVCGNDGTDVLGALHAALNLEGVDPCLHKVGYLVDELEVIRGEVVAGPGSAGHLGDVEAAAGLCAHPAVGRFPAEIAREKTEARLADAEGAVDEDLELAGGAALDLADLVEAEFAGEDNPGNTGPAHGVCGAGARDVHLGRGMDAELREIGTGHVEYAEILDDESVRPHAVQIGEKAVHALGFALLEDGVDRHEHLLAALVHGLEAGLELGPGEIGGAHPGVEALQAEIYRISPFVDRRVQRFRISGRCQ